MSERDPQIEHLAAWLHDNTRDLEHMVEGYQWPLHDNDDGYRGDGAYVRLIPKDIAEHHRDLARRTVEYFTRQLAAPVQPVADNRVKDSFGNDLIERELVSIILRMTRFMPDDKPAAKKLHDGAIDYLRRKSLLPSPLRADETVVQSEVVTTPAADAAEVERLRAEIVRLEDELDEARQEPWPKWAEAVLKVIREHTGYDGYDDAVDGVDMPEELSECLSELHNENERQIARATTAEAEFARLSARVAELQGLLGEALNLTPHDAIPKWERKARAALQQPAQAEGGAA